MERYKREFYKKHDLFKKTVVITGASSGAGRAAAMEFARHGAKIILASRSMEALDEVEAECREMGALALAVQADVTDAAAMQKLAATANEFGGSIDIWVNNAGVLAAGEFTETPVAVHDQVIRTNLLGYLHGAYAVLPYFKAQKYGILINNISVGGWIPVPYAVGYSASKFGLRGFSQALRGELVNYKNIHICDLFPAFLDSPGIQHAANYTGHYLKPAPPVYDPQRLARVMVAVAQQPKKAVTVGSVATFLRLAHSIMPAVFSAITVKTIEAYLKKADPVPESSGNVFAPVKFGTSIHGGWNSPADYEIRKKTVTRSLLIGGVTVGMLLLGRAKLLKKL
ncbi:SDR family oxidoreductase [Segetibacter koreensis]|uniref:SDR family oxidoreductase n=1 Tax=Segetibacter koreensis TaxID=398037 RepID=UPI000379FD0D|nr:SDR family oxidoreductase [Segetibacter koreensis]